MAIFIGLALALLSIGIVIYPFLKFRRSRRVYLRAAPPAKPGPETDPTLESIQEAIRTLDLEFDLGSIPEGLYREQLNDYQAQISQITQRQSRVVHQSVGRVLEWHIALEVHQLRRGGLRRRRRARRTYRPPPPFQTCDGCGVPLNPALTQCPVCSAALSPAPTSPGASQ